MPTKRALIVVDVQRDFCPGGALPVRNADSIIKPTNELISLFENEGSPIYFTRDWHPPNHVSFRPKGPWPPHCIRNTTGAEFHPSLHVPETATVISKGTEANIEAYSGFEGTDLARRLKQENVNELYVVGLATDYCVKNTVLDGISNGFTVDIVSDCVKGVNVNPLDSANTFRILLAKGVRKRKSQDILPKRKVAVGRRGAVSSSS